MLFFVFFVSLRLQGGRKKERKTIEIFFYPFFFLILGAKGPNTRQTHRNDTRSDFLDANASPSIVKRKERKKEEKKSCVNVVILSRRGSSSIFADRTHNNLAQATNNRKRKEERKWFPFYINIPIAVWVDGWRGPRIGHFSHFFVPLVLFSSCVYFLILPIFFLFCHPLGPSGRDGSFRNRIMSHPCKRKWKMAEYPVLFSFSLSYPAGPLGRDGGGSIVSPSF